MEFRDLKAQYRHLKGKMDQAVLEVMSDCNFISGHQVTELEDRLAAYVGRKHCIACGNGTDALTMVLKAWGIGPGDAVFVPDFTFFATAEVVAFEGAVPICVDVDPRTFNMDPASLGQAIRSVKAEGELIPKAVIPVDLFGLPADYRRILPIANEHNLLVLEDAAQGFGGKLDGKQAGSFGDASTTSFFPAKPLGCYGDGGAIFTDDDETATYIRSFQVHGKGSHKYENVRIGWNSRLDTMQAAILLVKLDAFQEFELAAVQDVAREYDKSLPSEMLKPFIPEGFTSSWAQYTVQVRHRDSVQEHLKTKSIPTMVYYPKPLHEQSAFKGFHNYVACPNAEHLCEVVLSLPMHPYVSNEDFRQVSDIFRTLFLGLNF